VGTHWNERAERGDAPRPSPERAARPATTRPTDGRVRAKPNSHVCRKLRARERGVRRGPLAVRQCRMYTHGLLPLDNSGGSRAVRRAGHAAGASAYAEERGLGMPCREGACVACPAVPLAVRGAQAKGARACGGADATAAPAPPPRGTRRACCVVVRVRKVFACTDRCAAVAWLWAAQRTRRCP
jgi:hypothetical protein